MNLIKITYYRLFAVEFPTNEYSSEIVAYFTYKKEAQKLADLKRGWYEATGTVTHKDFQETSMPSSLYESFDRWAKDNLTVNEYQKLKQ